MNSLTLLSVFNNRILYFLSAFLLQNFDFRTDFESIYKLFITIIIKIITTGLAGGYDYGVIYLQHSQPAVARRKDFTCLL